MLDPLLQEVVETWPKPNQVGRESVRNMAQLMRERAEGQRLLAEEKAEPGKVFRYEPVTNGTLQAV